MDAMGFDYFARSEPQALAIVDPRGHDVSRGELNSLVNRLSRAMRAAGLSRSDTVVMVAPNGVELIATCLAATQVGLYFVPVNWHLAADEVAHVIQDSDARLVIAEERFCRLVSSALQSLPDRHPLCVSIGSAVGFQTFDDFIRGHDAEPLPDRTGGRVMMYTSATTGRPKGVHLPLPESDSALAKTIRYHLSVGIGLGHGDVHLTCSMLYHAAPLDGALMALHMGHILVLKNQSEPEQLLQTIETFRVTTTVMVPTMFVRMLKLPEEIRRRYTVSSLRHVVHTGCGCPVESKRQMIEWWGPVLWDTYGGTEGAGTIVSSEEWLRYPGTVGRPIPGSTLRILNDEGMDVPPGEHGTIYLTRFTGDRFEYKGDPQKTRDCHRGDFFTLGDIGYLNPEGYLFLCDRKVDMIISAGMNIYSAEVERVLIEHPKVADCAVFGIADEVFGEVVKAVVQPMPGIVGSPALTLEITQFLRNKLSQVKIPRRIQYVTQLPRLPTGKLNKQRLKLAG